MLLLMVSQLFFLNEPLALSDKAPPLLVEGAAESEHLFILAMEKDNYARIHVQQIAAKVAVSIIDPSGTVVAANVHDNLMLSPVFLSFRASEKGGYTIRVRMADTVAAKRGGSKPEKGSFKIRVVELLNDEAFAAQQDALKRDARVAYVKKQAVPLLNLDPSEQHSDDLLPLMNQIGSARVVMIGDQTHFEAEAYTARMRLIRFLHEKMGFDVLAFESDIYSVRKLQLAIQNRVAGADPVWSEVVAPWARYREFDPIMNYVNARANDKKPLEIIGFDSQIGRHYAKAMLADELEALALSHGLSPLPASFRELLEAGMNLSYVMGEQPPPDAAAKEQFFKTLQTFARQLTQVCANGDDAEACFMVRCLDSLESIMVWFLKTPGELDADKEDFYTRDRSLHMARNIVWLANERFAGRKLIILAANAHIQADPAGVRESDRERSLHPHFLMGKLVREALGDQLFTIGITAYDGRFGPPRPGKSEDEYAYALLPDQEEGLGLEELFFYAGFDYAFLGFRNLGSEGAWLKEPITARPFGHHSFLAKWPDTFDGMLFIKNINPVHTREK